MGHISASLPCGMRDDAPAPVGARPWVAWLGALLLGGGVVACGGASHEPDAQHFTPAGVSPLGSPLESEPAPEADSTDGGLAGWPAWIRSPQPVGSVASRDVALYQACGTPDRGLVQVAGRILDRRLDGAAPYSPRQLDLLLRIAGLPQVWPRAWAVAGLDDGPELVARIREWAAREPVRGQRRCGIARGGDAEGRPLVAAVVLDALADVNPLPTRVRPSQWVDLTGTVHAPADAAHVLLLGPRGRPRKVLASLSGGRLRSRFSLDEPGPWLVQVLASLPNGPIPVLEAQLFAGVSPPHTVSDPAAPGRAPPLAPTAGPAELAAAFLQLLNAARRSERLPALGSDERLAAAARDHAAAMAQHGRLGHDLGEGTVDQRLVSAGWSAVHVGENVAAGHSVGRAHQALWASPSHRNNMLSSSFRRVGIGVVVDSHGTLWVVQTFSE